MNMTIETIEAMSHVVAMKQALEALESTASWNASQQYTREQKAITSLRTAIEAAEKPKYDQIELHVLHSHIAGVLFDFMGWLTTREKRLTLSSTDEAGPAVEAITAFAKMRGLRLEDAQVEHWQAILTTPPAAQRQWNGLTDEEILEAAGIDGADTWIFETAYAIEAKLRAVNGFSCDATEKNGGKHG